MRIVDGWLTDVTITPSPNFNVRPKEADISLVVIHNISLPPGEFGTGCVADFFQNKLDHDAHPFFNEIRGLEVSAHCFVDRSGSITQFVSFDDRAWHAGRSSYEGVDECNDYSIGIELEGTDELPYTDEQYACLESIVIALDQVYPKINKSRLVGHSDVAPGRKTDPGTAFDWNRLLISLEKY